MRARTLGWAGVELQAGATVVIDPLIEPAGLWAFGGDRAAGVVLPPVTAPTPGAAAAGLLTHLHRDHADASALAAALRPGAPVFAPEPFGGSDLEEAAVAQAAAELRDAGITLTHVRPWESVALDGWTFTALPAADGTGDPQVSWLVGHGDVTVLHAGDTLPHGWWWRIAERAGGPIDVAFLPVNAAQVRFPHRRPASPLPAVMGGREAAIAGAALQAARVVPMHFGAYDFPPFYVSDPDALATLVTAAAEHGVAVETPELGVWFDARRAVAA